MGEAREIPTGTYELKLGSTFDQHQRDKTFHTLRYDFKPKSVATETEQYIAFGGSGDVQVAVPGEGESMTVYKGSQKPVKAEKECLLFFDPRTGQVRLEKLSSNIGVKKTRDMDAATEAVLRAEISKLRTSKQKEEDIMTGEEMESSSSDSSDSDDDDEGESNQKPPSPQFVRQRESSDSSRDTGSDDEMQRELEKALASDTSYPSHERPAPIQHASTIERKKDILNDLILSESSEEDD